MTTALDRLCAELGVARVAPRSCLVVAAHPDDETIGATWLLVHAPAAHVVHVTDGAPRNPRLWPKAAPADRTAYADRRADEARRALGLVGVPPRRIHRLGFVDLEAAASLVPLARRLEALVAGLAPSLIVVHPYEGGHPDHDAAAFAMHAVLRRIRRLRPAYNPVLLEMTSYHRRGDALVTGAFLASGGPGVERRLSAAERDTKRAMLEAYASQADVLAPFRCETERYRLAPAYDFASPPHPGGLHYESLPFGWPFARFAASVRAANAALSLPPTSPAAAPPC